MHNVDKAKLERAERHYSAMLLQLLASSQIGINTAKPVTLPVTGLNTHTGGNNVQRAMVRKARQTG